jgi:hypothetical protein
MTLSKQTTTGNNEVIDIPTTETTKQSMRPGNVAKSIVQQPTRLPELEKAVNELSGTAVYDSQKDKETPTSQQAMIEPTVEATTVAPIGTNNDRIIQAATGYLIDTTPQATTPPPIDQVLVDTPVTFNDREAAEILGDLADTAIEGLKMEKLTNKRKTTTSSPALSTPTTGQTRRRIQERS